MEITVLTDPELGWDCILAVYKGHITLEEACENYGVDYENLYIVHHVNLD